jgi:hypothetical protein
MSCQARGQHRVPFVISLGNMCSKCFAVEQGDLPFVVTRKLEFPCVVLGDVIRIFAYRT